MRPLPRVGSDRAAETLAGIGAEIARFGTARLHVAMEAQKELAGCRSAGEMREVHARYVQRAMTDYAAEWLRLWEIGLGVAARPFDARPVPLPKRHATPV